MKKFDLSLYKKVLRVREAWRFDIGTMLMRMYGYMFTIGTVSMMTLAGYSAFVAGSVAAVIAISTFIIAPRVARLIDERGQRRIVPFAAAISLTGLIGLVCSVLFSWPLQCIYVSAALIGANPNAQALARARWTFLIKTGRCAGKGAEDSEGPDVRTAYAYEGVLEDIAFTVSPAINIALAAAIHPVAGMVFGGICLAVGTTIVLFARESEPIVGWGETVGCGAERADTTDDAQTTRSAIVHSDKSIFMLVPTVRVLFFAMVLMGLIFGSFDSAAVVYAQNLGDATIASVAMAISGVISAVAGFVFGMMRVGGSPARTLVITGALFGCGYALTALTCDGVTLVLLLCLASPFYAPFFITENTVCERVVPGSRLTEGISWMNAGNTAGFAFGPTVAGMLMDTFGGAAGFWLTAAAGLALPLLLLATHKIVARECAQTRSA